MDNVNTRQYRIQRRSDVQIAAVSLQREDYYPGLSALDRTALGTVIAELGTNILKYGQQGSIRVSQVEDGHRVGILVEAADQGPGIPDLDRALEEHYTTGNTLGLGLPAVKRMTDELGIITGPGEGTEVRALRWVRQETSQRGSRRTTIPPSAGPRREANPEPPPRSPDGRRALPAATRATDPGLLSGACQRRPAAGLSTR